MDPSWLVVYALAAWALSFACAAMGFAAGACYEQQRLTRAKLDRLERLLNMQRSDERSDR